MVEETVEEGQVVEEAPVEEQPDVFVDLNLSVKEVNQLLKVLGEAPFKDVNGLIQKIYTQGTQQVQAAKPE